MAVRFLACFSITIFTFNPIDSTGTKVYFSFFAEVRDFFLRTKLKSFSPKNAAIMLISSNQNFIWHE